MLQFSAAFALFLALHSVPALPAVRENIIRRTGRPLYFAVYSAVSVIALVWVFSAALSLDYVPLWDLKPWHAAITFVMTPVGVFLVLAGLFSRNPLSVSIRSSGTPAAISRLTRHPVLWGFAFWAIGHIAANGDLRSLVLFGGLALFSLGSMPMIEKRARRRLGPWWERLADKTSIIPFSAVLRGSPLRIDRPMAVAILVTAMTTAWLLFGGGHAMLVGADPVSIFL